MSAIQLKIIGAGGLFLLVFLSGYWLHHLGKPVPLILLTVHKLIALAAGVLVFLAVRQMSQNDPLDAVELISGSLAGLFFIGTVVTGGLMSLDKPLPAFVKELHQITPYLTLLASAGTLSLLLGGWKIGNG